MAYMAYKSCSYNKTPLAQSRFNKISGWKVSQTSTENTCGGSNFHYSYRLKFFQYLQGSSSAGIWFLIKLQPEKISEENTCVRGSFVMKL